MNMKRLFLGLIVACGLQAGTAIAQDNMIELTDDSVTVGGTATISAIWTDNGPVNTTVGFDITYDNTALTLQNCTILAPYNAAPYSSQCVDQGGGVIRFGTLQIPTGQIVSGTLFEVSFTANGPAGTYNVLVANPSSSTQPVMTDPGVIQVAAVPVPNYNSAPPPGGTLDFGTPVAGSGPVNQVLDIENNGIPTGGTMDVTCSITNNPGGVYSLVSPMDGMFTLDIGQSGLLTVACDTTAPIDATGGELSCSHTAPNSPNPATYTLDCFVTGEPTYGSNPAAGMLLDLGDVAQNSTPDPTTSLLINNDAGEVGSLLTGDCSLQFGTTPISLVGGPVVNYAVLQGTAAAEIALTCDTSGNIQPYADNLICTSNDPNAVGNFEYPVNCEILQPVAAQYASAPARDPGNDPGTIEIDITPVEPVLVGDPAPTANLNISNAAPANSDFLELTGCSITSGTGEITAAPPSLTTNLDPGQSTDVIFSCATGTAGTFFARYTCPYDESPTDPPPINGGGTAGTAIYDVRCEVRDPNSQVVESPPSGTPQTAELMPNESITFEFTFTETIGEGADASLDDCTLATDTDFSITAGGPFPQTIPSGGSVQVDVTFNDPGAGEVFTDTLSCSFTDSPPPPPVPGNEEDPEGAKTFVSWPLEVTVIGRNARFNVTKDFDDDNPMGVEVTLDCNTGLPLMQTGTVHDPDAGLNLNPGDFTKLEFIVVDFEPGALDCDIFETVPTGYEGSYAASVGNDGVAASVFDDENGCHYEGIESADFVCEVTNELQASTVTVNKEWIDENPEFALPTWVEITLFCNEPISGGFLDTEALQGDLYSISTYIQPEFPGVFEVFPHWDGTTECFVTETPEAGVLPDTSDCESIPLAPGVDGECTIVNTRLYAGIPTLSQYGLMLMALLMLGVGLVAFRRYS